MTTTITITMLVAGTLMVRGAFVGLALGSGAVTILAEPRQRVRLKRCLLVVAAFLALSTVTGCGAGGGPSACATGGDNHLRVTIVSAANERRPLLTGDVVRALRDAATLARATGGSGGKARSAALITAYGRVGPAMGLTSRRTNCAVEYNDRECPALHKKDTHDVVETVAKVTATQPGMKLLDRMDDAVRGTGAESLIIDDCGLSTTGGLAGSAMSWRRPESTVIIQVLSGVVLVCLGLLLGSSWTVQALQSKLRRQAEERRRLNEEWLAVRTARRQRDECPRCASPLSERDW